MHMLFSIKFLITIKKSYNFLMLKWHVIFINLIEKTSFNLIWRKIILVPKKWIELLYIWNQSTPVKVLSGLIHCWVMDLTTCSLVIDFTHRRPNSIEVTVIYIYTHVPFYFIVFYKFEKQTALSSPLFSLPFYL